MRPVRATYRLQLRPGFGFDEAAAVVPYLAALGISHVYTSPYLATTPGSTHGYDIVDHGAVRDDLGGPAAFDRYVATLHEHGLGQVLDIVPHHMSIAGTGNRWWWDVLTFGRSSRFAGYFDIDWDPPETKLRATVLLPVLGDHYGRVLEAGDLQLARREDGSVVVTYYDLELPLAPRTVAAILGEAAQRRGDDRLGFLARALANADVPDADPDVRASDVIEVLRLVRELDPPGPGSVVDDALERVNREPDHLDTVLDAQHYRLARWTVGAYELDYRRFFDVDSLIALRAERDDVFEATHRLVLGWVREGVADGLRVDHVDGLREPEAYLERLRAQAGDDAYLIVEKILSPGEELPAWPIDGTTGYEFADLATGVLVDGEGADSISGTYRSFLGGDVRSYREESTAARRQLLATSLASDLERLTDLLTQICEHHRAYRDFTRRELRRALAEVAVHVPAYRSYVSVADGEPVVSDADLRFIDLAIGRARDDHSGTDPEVFDLIRAVLTMDFDGADERELALRFQQLTGPVVAKGDEDTAHYRSVALVARNEVGVHPDRLFVDPDALHEANRARHEQWPRSMVTTSTHDTKRGEDVRARLAVLAEVPLEWDRAVWRWSRLAEPHRSEHGPDPRTEWLIYETMIGAHPIGLDRLLPYLEKAMREAKDHTSWTEPDAAYEEAVRSFVAGIVGDVELHADLAAFAELLVEPGRVNALAQVALRLLSPGIPDTYQGTEVWDSSLVDPDNRRPVDYDARASLLAGAANLDAATTWREAQDSGLPKLVLLQRALALRNELPGAFDERGSYEPLVTSGPLARHALGFLRGGSVALVVPRLPLRLGEQAGEVLVGLPAGTWHDVLGARAVRSRGTISLGEAAGGFPVAVLRR